MLTRFSTPERWVRFAKSYFFAPPQLRRSASARTTGFQPVHKIEEQPRPYRRKLPPFGHRPPVRRSLGEGGCPPSFPFSKNHANHTPPATFCPVELSHYDIRQNPAVVGRVPPRGDLVVRRRSPDRAVRLTARSPSSGLAERPPVEIRTGSGNLRTARNAVAKHPFWDSVLA